MEAKQSNCECQTKSPLDPDKIISASYEHNDLFGLRSFNIKIHDPSEGLTQTRIVMTGKYHVQPHRIVYFQKLNQIKPNENVIHCLDIRPNIPIFFKKALLPPEQTQITKKELLESWVHLRHSDPISQKWTKVETLFLKTESYQFNLGDWTCKYLNTQFLSNPVHIRKIQRIQLVMAQNLLDGVKYLHSNGIVHGSLRSSNLVFSHHDEFALPLKIAMLQLPSPYKLKQVQDDICAVGYLLKIILVPVIEDVSTGTLSNKWEKETMGHPIVGNYQELVWNATEKTKAERFRNIEEMTLILRDSPYEDNRFEMPPSILKLLTVLQDQRRDGWFHNLKIMAILGWGSFGYVMKARDTYQNETAVKVLSVKPRIASTFGSETSSEVEIEDPAKEYENMKEVYHRNLVNLFQYKETRIGLEDIHEIFKGVDVKEVIYKLFSFDGFLNLRVIEMELCGSNLDEWIREFPNSVESQDCGMFQFKGIIGLVYGLTFLHERNIIHRDLSPVNIFFTKGFQLPLKIGDFGLCKQLLQPKTGLETDTPGSKIGNEIYRAPETEENIKKLYASEPYYERLADIYSLGLIIWRVSDPANVSDSSYEELVHEEKTELVHTHKFILNLRDFILEMTRRDPKTRLQNLRKVHLSIGYPESETPIIIRSSDSEEFQLVLNHCVEGSRIQLSKGTYQGPFKSERISVQVMGGPETILETVEGPSTCLQLFGENSSVRNVSLNCDSDVAYSLDLNGNGCSVKDVTIRGGVRCINVNADDCTLENVRIWPSEHGILILGSNTRCKNIRLENGNTGVAVYKFKNTEIEEEVENNQFEGVEIKGFITGMEIYGNGTKVKDTLVERGDYYYNPELDWGETEVNGEKEAELETEVETEVVDPKCGLIIGSSECDLENVRAIGYSYVERKELGLRMKNQSARNNVKESTFDSVLVLGNSNVLNGVKSGEFIQVGEQNKEILEMRVNNGELVAMGVKNGELVEMGVNNGELVAMGVKNGELVKMGVQNGELVEMGVKNGELVEIGVKNWEFVKLGVKDGEVIQVGDKMQEGINYLSRCETNAFKIYYADTSLTNCIGTVEYYNLPK